MFTPLHKTRQTMAHVQPTYGEHEPSHGAYKGVSTNLRHKTNTMNKLTLTLFALTITATITFGQTQKATTDNGKKVILNPNGTWKYVDTLKTSQLKLDSNDCTNWIKTDEDKVSGQSYTSMKEGLVISKDGGEKGFGINLFLGGKNTVIFSIVAAGAGGCIDKGARINILFTDGTRLELASEGDFNCKGNATVYFGGMFGKKNQLIELKTKRIDVMRVWTNDGYVEETFSEEESEQFKNAVNCLTK